MKPTVSDKILRDAVLKELEDEPEVIAKHISVTANRWGDHGRRPRHVDPREARSRASSRARRRGESSRR
jgi:hypothetical protein